MRTKYDRMFERKNQNILSEHYTKLVDHSKDIDSEDEFITLKRADHDLPSDGELPDHEYISKRKQKMAKSKKALAKVGPKGHKLVFDEEGIPHEVYEMKSAEEIFKGEEDVRAAGRRFAEKERGRLKEADIKDKAEAKDKKREKKRKRKEREREVRVLSSYSTVLRCLLRFHRKMGRDLVEPLRLLQVLSLTTVMSPLNSTYLLSLNTNVVLRLLPPANAKNCRMARPRRRHWQMMKLWYYRCCVVEGSRQSFGSFRSCVSVNSHLYL